MQKTKLRQKGPKETDSTAVGGTANAPGDRKGPKEKDSTAVGGTANATGDRQGPIPSIIIVQKKKTHTESSFFAAGDGNRTRTVSLGS